jgi:hypothetical protein
VRRLLRILLNAATALSLVLCVATGVLWARSYRSIDMLTIGERRQLSSWLGGLQLLRHGPRHHGG